MVLGGILDVSWALALALACWTAFPGHWRRSSVGVSSILIASTWMSILNLHLLRMLGSSLDPFLWSYAAELSNVGFATSVAVEIPWMEVAIQLVVGTGLEVLGLCTARRFPDVRRRPKAALLVAPLLILALAVSRVSGPGTAIAGADGLTWLAGRAWRTSLPDLDSLDEVVLRLRPTLVGEEVYWSSEYPLVRGTPRALCRAGLVAGCADDEVRRRDDAPCGRSDDPRAAKPDAAQPLHGCTIAQSMPDVLVIQMESLPAWTLAALGGREEDLVSPHLEALLRRDDVRLFVDHESNGSQTAPGLVALLCSMWPYHGDMLTRLRPPMRCLPQILIEQGYTAVSVIAGDFWFDDQGEFLRAIGFERVETVDEIMLATGSRRRLPWGATDEDLFERIARILEEPADGPRFVFAQTVGNHHPYEVPAVPADRAPSHPVHRLARDRSVLATSAYADWSLGPLLEAIDTAARASARGMLVVIIGDNGHPRPTHAEDRFTFVGLDRVRVHTPWIVWAPGRPALLERLTPEVTSMPTSTVDVLPTLLGILTIDTVHASAGVDVARARSAGRFATVTASGGLIRFARDGMVLHLRLFPANARIFASEHEEEGRALSAPELTARMVADAQAHAAAVNALVEWHRIWPGGSDP